MTRKNGLELTTGIVTLVLAAISVIFFCLSYTTGYYIFGQMQSGVIAVLLGGGIAFEVAALILRAKLPAVFWPKLLTYVVTGVLAAAAMLLVGDRVEGIGNCIVTDYDSGHGGEEAIYLSLAAAALMLAAMIYNMIGSFAKDKTEAEGSTKTAVIARSTGFGASALAVVLAVLIPTVNLVGSFGGSGTTEGGGTGGAYAVSFNQNNGNAEGMPTYQFLCCDFSGMVKADTRFYVDVALTLDGNGGYQLFSEGYVIENGKRAEIGDDTGLGLILTMNAEGTYTENADGTYTTSVPGHAVFEMKTDTYSAQMKEAAGMAVNGNSEDGVYESDSEPAVLDFVPETIWTLGSEGDIITWEDPNAESVEEPETEETKDTQVPDTAGTGLTVTSDDGATTFTFNADGTYLFAFEAYGVEDAGTYTYDGTTLTVTNANGEAVTAEGDPLTFHYVTAVSDQLTGDFTVNAAELPQ